MENKNSIVGLLLLGIIITVNGVCLNNQPISISKPVYLFLIIEANSVFIKNQFI
jgi:hypothetical protein